MSDSSNFDKVKSCCQQDVQKVRETLTDHNALVRLVTVRLLYALVLGVVLGPLMAWLIQWLARRGGDAVVSNFDLTAFFLSPGGVAFLALTSTFAVTTFFFEQSGMILVAKASLAGGRLPYLMEVLWVQKKQFPRLLQLGFFYFLAALLVALPVLIVAGVCLLTMLSDRDINYYISVKPPGFWRAVAYTSVAGLVTFSGLLWMYLRWFMAVPILLFEGVGVRESIRRSSERSAGRAVVFGVEMLALTALASLSLGAGALLLKGLDKIFFEYFADQIQLVVVGAGLILAVQFVFATVITFFGFAAQCVLITRHYLATGSPLVLVGSYETAGKGNDFFVLQRSG